MTFTSQLRLCRACIIIGSLFCIVAMLEVGTGLAGLFRSLGETEAEAVHEPAAVGAIVGEMIIVVIVRLWPLPLALIFLIPSLVWRHRLRRTGNVPLR